MVPSYKHEKFTLKDNPVSIQTPATGYYNKTNTNMNNRRNIN